MTGVATVGCELEWADVDRHAEIPSHLGTWATEDYSIVNSDGHANCPSGATWRWGGEINTVPTETAAGQAEICRQLAEWAQPKPIINWKCNLHVHVRPASFVALMQDLSYLKRFASYLRAAERFVYSTIEVVPRPTQEEYPDLEHYRGAMRRYRRRLISHQHSLSDARWTEIMAASTHEEFLRGHASPTQTGGRAWHLAPRPGMNLRSLWKHGTVEFRHFPGTADPEEVESACSWCLALVEAAEYDEAYGPVRIYESRFWRFPTFRPYDHEQWLGFERTKHA